MAFDGALTISFSAEPPEDLPPDYEPGCGMPAPRHYYRIVDPQHPAFLKPEAIWRAQRGLAALAVVAPQKGVEEPRGGQARQLPFGLGKQPIPTGAAGASHSTLVAPTTTSFSDASLLAAHRNRKIGALAQLGPDAFARDSPDRWPVGLC